MERLPFPDKSTPPSSESVAPGRKRRAPASEPVTVTELSERIKRVVAGGFPAKIRVVGEISNFSDRSHWFFSLKDDGAAIRCVCFASSAKRMGFTPQDGAAVVATGRVDYYDTQGQLQFYVDKLEPVGAGALELRFRALCEQLKQLGYFDEARKKTLPVMPQAVAVVTSRAAAALQDVIRTTQQRWPGCRLLLLDVRVQGESAAPEIAQAINVLSKQGAAIGVEAILLTRGGGGVEDLWAFNERLVADAIFRCRLPIVAAIGHETDITIAELVADRRCSTPTQAAMLLTPDQASLTHQLRQLMHRLSLLMRRRLEQDQQRLRHAARHPALLRPDRMVETVRQRLQDLSRRLHLSAPQRVVSARQRLDALSRQLEAVGPHQVLQRGYSYTYGPNGQLLRSAKQAKPGGELTTVLADGRVQSVVKNSPSDAPDAKPLKTKRRVKASTDAPSSLGLFG